MSIWRHVRFVRLALAVLLAVGVSAGVSATQNSNCYLDCGGGCRIVVFNCPGCTEGSASDCEIYWTNTACADNFYCSPDCFAGGGGCYTWEN